MRLRGLRGLVVAAPASGHGKTVLTLGLMRALADRGVPVVPGKAGPDYIDPGFHARAAGRESVTLDPWAAGAAQLRARASEAAGAAGPDGVLVVEGAMGLHDRPAGAGTGATADLAAALGLPVVLVLDAKGQGQSAGAVAAGLAAARPDLRVVGAILNRVASPRHRAMLAEGFGGAIPLLGTVPPDPALRLRSRHLGLVQAEELADLETTIAAAARHLSDGVDLAAVLAPGAVAGPTRAPRRLAPPGQRIALARDRAFSFVYPHLLGDWRAAGAEIHAFSPLADEGPDPGADAIVLPGGYPELAAGRLAAAAEFRRGMAAARDRGARIYGECGGYMVLGEGLTDADGVRHAMLGLLRLETRFDRPRLHLGYRGLCPAPGAPEWPGPVRGHEFHYAETARAEGAPLFAAADAAGRPLGPMGLVEGRVAGSFAHAIEPA
ncbi:MAG: cobyrinate a,c-diamide synthase [Paracoccaceae bacterium]